MAHVYLSGGVQPKSKDHRFRCRKNFPIVKNVNMQSLSSQLKFQDNFISQKSIIFSLIECES